MKKGGTLNPDKIIESKNFSKSFSEIKFNLSAHNLACFKNKDKTYGKSKGDSSKEIKWYSQIKSTPINKGISQGPSIERNRTISCHSTFDERVVIMQYDNIDVYIDNSTQKKSKSKESKESQKGRKKSQSDEGHQDEFLESCVRVITQQTDNTSNTLSQSTYQITSPYLTPRSSQMGQYLEVYDFYESKGKVVRNKRSVTNQQSKAFLIDFDNIEKDGRTTVMVKNIPNKYTQQMLLEEFTINYENKFDFFYLPIDKDVHIQVMQNDCNVGYAFVNFINASYLKDFYKQFHLQKWKKYKSPKICNICYARYQGTLQLADHFKHTKIIHQKDRKVKPLIGIYEANKIKDIKEIIKNQRNHE